MRRRPPFRYCAGITRAGRRCRHAAQFGSDYCAQHDDPPSFDQLLRDTSEQFDPRSELLPRVIAYIGLPSPTAEALTRSIEEYRNAPPCAVSAPTDPEVPA